MDTLWLKFPDEVLFSSNYPEEERKTLENIFSASDKMSAWISAINAIGLQKPNPDIPMLKWHDGAPYFNWSFMAAVISGGTMRTVRDEKSGYRFDFDYSVKGLARMVRTQWKISRYLRDIDKHEDSITTSLALGLVLQSLVMRLGPDNCSLAEWLANPQTTPQKYKTIIEQIQAVQVKRTAMSYVWKEIVPSGQNGDAEESTLPDFFWNDETAPVQKPEIQKTENTGSEIKGTAVCAGQVTGLAVAMIPSITTEELLTVKEKYNAPLVLVFKYAKPETIELFPYADAVLFCNGGALAHACVIAREMNLPCVTALGNPFFENINDQWLTVNGSTGEVTLTEN